MPMVRPAPKPTQNVPWPSSNAPGVKASLAAEVGEGRDDHEEHRDHHDDEHHGGELADLPDLAEQRQHDQQRDADPDELAGACSRIVRHAGIR